MDKKTLFQIAVERRLALLEERQGILREEAKRWNALVIKCLLKLLGIFAGIIISGLSFAFYVIHSSENIRQAISNWWIGK